MSPTCSTPRPRIQWRGSVMERTTTTGAGVLLVAFWTTVVLVGAPWRLSATDGSTRGQSSGTPEIEESSRPGSRESPGLESRESVGAAQLKQGYSMSWWTVDGGGGTSAGGSLSLAATLAQPDAGSLAGPGLTLDGGFWSRAMTPPEPPLFSDGFETGDTSRWSSGVPLKNRKAAGLRPDGGE